MSRPAANLSAAVASKRAVLYRRVSASCPPAVITPTVSPRGSCACAENAMVTASIWPKSGGSGTLPRFVSIAVSHTSWPTVCSAMRTWALPSLSGLPGHIKQQRLKVGARRRRNGSDGDQAGVIPGRLQVVRLPGVNRDGDPDGPDRLAMQGVPPSDGRDQRSDKRLVQGRLAAIFELPDDRYS